MLTGLQSANIERFKCIADVSLDLKDVNILIGGNNSGKSSIIQGLHFGIALLQTIGLAEKWKISKKKTSLSTSVNPTQLIYSPSEDAYALGLGGKLLEQPERAIRLVLNLKSGESCSVSARKGRNRNLLVTVENTKVAAELSSIEKPFSIFSPGLAGIVKREPYVSDGVLFRALARGDANLVLRNILLRLWSTAGWEPFLADLHQVFPGLDIEVKFSDKSDEIIEVNIKSDAEWVPLEVAGTGVLQATQILSYIHRFSPPLIVLDEPDSHLHPNNQRLLCALLRQVAEERGTQVILTTHSRHVVDSIGTSTGFFWVRNGKVDPASTDDELGILLDIGALDIKERVGQKGIRAVVLTEDELTKSLEVILEGSGFELANTILLPYYGVTTLRNLRPLVRMIQSTSQKARLILHRDRDFLYDDEIESWMIEVRKLGVEPFVTKRRDVESYFLDANHLAKVNPARTEEQFTALIDQVGKGIESQTLQDYVNGRLDYLRKSGNGSAVNAGEIAVAANAAVSKDIQRYCGKTALRALRKSYQKTFGENLVTHKHSDYLNEPVLAAIAKKTFK